MREGVLRFIEKHQLLGPGDRVAVACSAGADSVALLRVLIELREKLGVVLSIAHFNHQLRTEADLDEQFARELAHGYRLAFRAEKEDVATLAHVRKLSLETAARDARYRFFDRLIASREVDKIALAHSANDQAETVLMKLLRGAGGRGMAAIAPWRSAVPEVEPKPVRGLGYVRPLLAASRHEIEAYLHGLKQSWREDPTNQSPEYNRNRVRQQLLPLLIREYNPNAVATLGHSAEIARAEEEFWETEVGRILPTLMLPGGPARGGGRVASGNSEGSIAVDIHRLTSLPLAMRRRIIRRLAERVGGSLDFEQTAAVLDLSGRSSGSRVQLGGNLIARRAYREIVLESAPQAPPLDYEYQLQVPGAICIPELAVSLRAKLVIADKESTGYNPAQRGSLPASVKIRNWRAGDRVRLAYSKSDKKIKEILQAMHLERGVRQLWPVAEDSGSVIWVRGCELPPVSDGLHHVVFEESKDTE